MTSSRSVHHGQHVCCIQTAVPTEISKVLIRFTLITRLCSYQSIQLSKIVLENAAWAAMNLRSRCCDSRRGLARPLLNVRRQIRLNVYAVKSNDYGVVVGAQHQAEFGGADRDRTGDPLLAKQVLSQLSYSPQS
jgi:hypothetical protein